MALFDINYDNLTGEDIKKYLEYFKECSKISPLTPEEEGQVKILTELFVIDKYKEERDAKLRFTTDKFNNVESMRDYLYGTDFDEHVKDDKGNYVLRNDSPLLGKGVNTKFLDGIYRVPITTFNKDVAFDVVETEDKLSDLLGEKFDEASKQEYKEISDSNSVEFIYARFDHTKPSVVTEVITNREIPLCVEHSSEQVDILDKIFKWPITVGFPASSGSFEGKTFNSSKELKDYFIENYGYDQYKKFVEEQMKKYGITGNTDESKSEYESEYEIAMHPSFTAYMTLNDDFLLFEQEKLETMSDKDFCEYIRMNDKNEMTFKLKLLEKTGLREKCEFLFERFDDSKAEIEQEYIDKVIRFKNK